MNDIARARRDKIMKDHMRDKDDDIGFAVGWALHYAPDQSLYNEKDFDPCSLFGLCGPHLRLVK